MSWNALSLPVQVPSVQVLNPAADAAGRTSTYVSLKNATRATFVFEITQGNAATILLSLLQASAVAGTGSKAGPTAKVWACADTSASDALVAQTDGATFTTDAGLKNKRVMIQVDAIQLDVANGFDCVAVSTGASNAANITSCTVFLSGERYQQTTPPSAIVD